MLSDNTQQEMMVYGFVNCCIRTVFSGSICIVLNFIFDFIDKYYKKKGKWGAKLLLAALRQTSGQPT